MKRFLIALQLYSVRDELAADFEGTLKRVKELGYDGVEFAGLCDKTASEVKSLCQQIGLVPISAHVSELMDDSSIMKTYAEIGCKYVVVPWVSTEYHPDGEKFGEIIEKLKSIGKQARECGLRLGYHNHDFEFKKINGEYGLDVIYGEVSADLLDAELDTCWVNVGGCNPSEYIRKYAGRIGIIHLKDFTGGKSENMYALIGKDEDEKKEVSGEFEFRPVGYGVQNFPEIVKAADEVNAEWLVVEQDMPSMGKTPMECAEMSINYLKTIL